MLSFIIPFLVYIILLKLEKKYHLKFFNKTREYELLTCDEIICF